jgi:hypothetical protein
MRYDLYMKYDLLTYDMIHMIYDLHMRYETLDMIYTRYLIYI